MRRFVSYGLGLVLLSQPAWGEEPGTAAAGGKSKPAGASPAAKRSSTPAQSAGEAGKAPSPSGATETVALEIVAKAPKPIPPVELDMLQLRLMLTDLKASFADQIDRALFREPF